MTPTLLRCTRCGAHLIGRRPACVACRGASLLDAAVFVVALVVIGVALGAVSCGGGAWAQDRPRLSAPDRLDLRRCLVLEADAHTEDYAPILSVLSARAARVGSTPANVARRYCAGLHATRPSRRQAAILALPGGPAARQYVRAWAAAGEALSAWERGDGATCPATHWGSAADGAPRSWVRVDCGMPGRPTLNRFYREPPRVAGAPIAARLARGRDRR